MGSIADIYAVARLVLDTNTFEAQAAASGDRAGTTAGTRMRAQLSRALSGVIRTGIGAAAGLTFAEMTQGALALNEAGAQYQMQTGANDQATKAFEKTLDQLFATSHQGYDEISQTLIGLKTHFDLDGAAAKATAADFLDFAEVAGGTGSDAVERFNSLIKTGIITLADRKKAMDDLLVAHQDLGIPINDTIDGMVRLAPAMNAVNMSFQDGVALVGLFTKAGVGADRMAQAFNTALTKVKSPAEFRKVINDIATAKDEFTASKLAAEYFGTRVGPALANLLRQGSDALDGYNASLGDTTGALDKAAAANDNSWGGRALLMLHRFQAGLADIGTSMGDLLIIASLIGPGLTKGLAAGIGGLAGALGPKIVTALLGPSIVASTTVGTAMGTATATSAVATEGTGLAAGQAAVAAEATPAAAAAGTSIGSVLGAALSGAVIGAAIAAVGIAFVKINDEVERQAAALTAKTTAYVKTATLDQLQKAKAGLEAELEAAQNPFSQPPIGPLNLLGPAGVDVLGVKGHIQDQIDIIQQAIDEAVGGTAGGGAAGGGAGGPLEIPISVAVEFPPVNLEAAIKTYVAGVPKAVRQMGGDVQHVMRDDVQAWWDIMHAAGITVGRTFAEGIALSGPAVRSAAEGVFAAAASAIKSQRKTIDDAIDTLNADLKRKQITQTKEVENLVRALISKGLSAGLKSPDAETKADARLLEQELLDRLAEIKLRPGIISDKTKKLIEAAKKSADPTIRDLASTYEKLLAQDLSKVGGSSKVTEAGKTVGTSSAQSMVQGFVEWLRSPGVASTIADAWAFAMRSIPGWIMPAATGHNSGGDAYSGRASGGPVSAGRPYWVGEAGRPELFVPSTSGRIVPESQAPGGHSGSGGQTFNINELTVADAYDEQSALARLRFLAALG